MSHSTHRITVSILFLIVAAFASPAYAQSAFGLQITPGVIEDRVNPGDVYTFSLKVTNTSDQDRTFYLVAQDIKGLDAEGKPIFAEQGESTEYDLSHWIVMPQESITLRAGEAQQVSYAVNVPANASPGSHFGGVFFETQPPRLRQTGAAIGVQVGSVISLRIAGDAVEDARLLEFSTSKMIYNDPSISFQSRVENLGNVLVRPHGFVRVTDMFGRDVASVNVNESGAPVFPLSERSYVVEWTHDGFAFGRYQAVASLVYGEDVRKTISGTTSFWILPLRTILIVLGTILSIILVLYIFARMYVRKKLKELGVNGRKAESQYYARRYGRSSSPLALVFSSLFLFSMICLIVLFLVFS